MPWCNENLDSDLENELNDGKTTQGKFLDLGTTQSTWIATKFHGDGF